MGKSPFSMGKLTISMAIFNSFLYVYQRVIHLALDLGFSDDHQSPAEPSLAQETKNGSPRSTDHPPLCCEETPQKTATDLVSYPQLPVPGTNNNTISGHLTPPWKLIHGSG